MNAERYRQVNALADAALAMPSDRRLEFLDHACGGDPLLRKELEALVESDSAHGNFLEQPLLQVLAGDLLGRPGESDVTGRRIEHFESNLPFRRWRPRRSLAGQGLEAEREVAPSNSSFPASPEIHITPVAFSRRRARHPHGTTRRSPQPPVPSRLLQSAMCKLKGH